MIDVVLVNDTPVSADLGDRYEQAGVVRWPWTMSGWAAWAARRPRSAGHGQQFFRHDPALLSQALIKLVC